MESNGKDKIKRRSRLNIMAEILNAAMNGAVKTRIMYMANVNFTQYNEYMRSLLEAQLIKTFKHDGKTYYKTTEKGMLLLQRLNEAEEIFNAIENEEKPIIVKKRSMVYLVKK